MKTVNLSLSDLVKESVCTYRWPLRYIFDDLGRFLEDDLQELKSDDNKIEVEWVGLVDMDNIDIDYNCDDWIYEWIESKFKDNIESELLIDTLAKYWLKYKGLSFYKNPGAYNFAWDSVDIEYEYDDDIKWQEKYPELIDEVEYYIKEVRQWSYDWYCSFEPTDIDKVEMNDYAYIWAILHKEDMLDDLKTDIQEWVEDILQSEWYEYDTSCVYLRGEDWHIDWDTKYCVDYHNKKLVKCDE